MLAGRESLETYWRTMLSDIGGSGRKHARDIILRGPRGTGKTVLLTRFQQLAEDQGYDTISLQMTKGGAGIIAGILACAHRLSQQKPAWQRARGALQCLAATDVTAGEIATDVAVTARTPGTPVDPGPLTQALATLAREIRTDAPGGGLLITLDELQVSRAADLALLAAALQWLNVEHPGSSVAFAASALPTINDVLRDAGVTPTEGPFKIEPIALELGRAGARFAIVEPARRRGVIWNEAGADALLAATRGYPAHLQLFADQTWKLAAGPHEITAHDAERGIAEAERHVEIRTLEPRWRRATDRDVELLAALAVATTAAPGAHYASTAQISNLLGRAVNEWSVTRIHLINESDIYAPARGQLAFTVPTYAPYILRNYERRRAQARLALTPLPVMSQRTSRAPTSTAAK